MKIEGEIRARVAELVQILENEEPNDVVQAQINELKWVLGPSDGTKS